MTQQEFDTKMFDIKCKHSSIYDITKAQSNLKSRYIKYLLAELEAMQNAKSCEGCVDFKNNVCTDIDWCGRDKRLTDNYKLKAI